MISAAIMLMVALGQESLPAAKSSIACISDAFEAQDLVEFIDGMRVPIGQRTARTSRFREVVLRRADECAEKHKWTEKQFGLAIRYTNANSTLQHSLNALGQRGITSNTVDRIVERISIGDRKKIIIASTDVEKRPKSAIDEGAHIAFVAMRDVAAEDSQLAGKMGDRETMELVGLAITSSITRQELISSY